MPNPSHTRSRKNSSRLRSPANSPNGGAQISSEEAIKAGEQIAMAAFASGLKLAAAFGTVAAKTAGLAFSSLASGADKFSELVKEEALRSYNGSSRTILKERPKRAQKSGSRRKTR